MYATSGQVQFSATSAAILCAARLTCSQWQSLSVERKHQILTAYFGKMHGMNPTSSSLNLMMNELNLFCAGPVARPAGATGDFGSGYDHVGDERRSDAQYPDRPATAPSSASSSINVGGLLNTVITQGAAVGLEIYKSISSADKATADRANALEIERIRSQASQTTDSTQRQILESRLSALSDFQSQTYALQAQQRQTTMLLIGGAVAVGLVVTLVVILSQKKKG